MDPTPPIPPTPPAAPVPPPAVPAAPPAPPAKEPFFRWKHLGPALAVMALGLLFYLFFMDCLVKAAIEKAGTAANGAKVELGSAKVSLIHLSVTLTGLQVTDAGAPMTNAVEAGRLNFKLAAKPLFWKKLIIEDASIQGIRTGTPRKRSGALSRAKAADKEEKKPAAGLAALDNVKKQYDPRNVKLEDLASYKKIKEEQVHWTAQAESWQARVDAVKFDDREKEVKDYLEKVKSQKISGVKDLKKAADLAKEGKRLADDLESSKKGFDALKKDLSDEIGRAQGSLKEIEELKRKDADASLGDIKEAFSTEGIIKGLIGPQWAGKVETGLAWFRKVRSLVPQKKAAEKEPPPPPRHGKDIPFPFKYNWPAFHLKKAVLDGETPGGLAYTGTLRDVASEPKKVGRPIALDVAGRKGGESLSLRAELDYTKDTPRERVRLSCAGFPLAGVPLGDAAGPVRIASGAGKTAVDLETRGDNLAGRVDFTAAPVKLDHQASSKDRLAAALHGALTSVKKLDVTFLVSGTAASPAFKVRSSLDDQVAGAVKAAAKKELDELRARAQGRVNELVGGEEGKLSGLVNGRAAEASKKMGLKDNQLKSLQAQLQKAAAGPASSGGKPKLKKLFK